MNPSLRDVLYERLLVKLICRYIGSKILGVPRFNFGDYLNRGENSFSNNKMGNLHPLPHSIRETVVEVGALTP